MPELFLSREADQATGRVQALYDHVAHDYDEVFSSHVTEHYLRKRTTLVNELLPSGGSVLDVGCGTGALAGRIQRLGFDVVGVDASAGMLAQALEHGVGAVYAAYSTALPFEDGSFDLALSVATMHHLETAERVAATIAEMGRVRRSASERLGGPRSDQSGRTSARVRRANGAGAGLHAPRPDALLEASGGNGRGEPGPQPLRRPQRGDRAQTVIEIEN